MWIHVFPVWPPPSWISEWYGRVLPLAIETSLSSPNKKPDFFSHITYGLFTTDVLPYIAYFRWISQIKVANMTSCLLRSRDVKVMKLMLSCRELVVHKIIKNFCYTVMLHRKECSGGFPPICNTRVNRGYYFCCPHNLHLFYPQDVFFSVWIPDCDSLSFPIQYWPWKDMVLPYDITLHDDVISACWRLMHYDVKISGARIRTHDLWIRKRVCPQYSWPKTYS